MNLSLLDFIKSIYLLIKTILFLINFYSILINFLIPSFYIVFKNYKKRKLKNKNIPVNINHLEKKCFIHFWTSIHAGLILMILLIDNFKEILNKIS
ncbi:MAG: hypothetical protein AB3F67_1310 [Candidatus Phytoplasma solani]